MYLKRYIFHFLVILVAVLSLMPSMGGGSSFKIKHFDKIAHILMYAAVSFTMLKFYWENEVDRKSMTYTFLFSVSYGILLEILQNTSFSQREFDIFDILANIIGAISGIAFFKLFKKYNLWK